MTTPIDVFNMSDAELAAEIGKAESYALEGSEYAKALVAEHNPRRDVEVASKIAYLTKWIVAGTLVSMMFVILSALGVAVAGNLRQGELLHDGSVYLSET